MNTVESRLPAGALERLALRVEAETGLHFAPSRQHELGSALHRMAQSGGFGADHACIDWLLAGRWDQRKADLCARHLTIGETYFFREPRGFELVCDYARQKIRAGGAAHAPLRLWSAGCCTGEEPYSMAMALRQAVPELDPARLSILGTDLNSAYLEFARKGVYRPWSFRCTDPALRTACFSALGEDQFALRPALRAQVRFAQMNLASPVYPSATNGTEAIDIIFCRNVLMYFSRGQMKLVIERLRACLVDGGWLVVNPSEASAELFAGFTASCYPDAILFQKTGQPGRPAAAGGPALIAAVPPLPVRRAARARPSAPCMPRPAPAAVAGAAAAVQRAQALAQGGDGAAALRTLAQACEAWPLAGEPYQAAAQIALEQGDHAMALGHLKRLLYLQPDSIMAHYLAAVVQLAQGRRAAALRQLRACEALLAALADDALVPGSDGWPAASLRAAVRRLEQGT
jgi:chemotaxis protein methyltransferase CheR